MLKNSRVSSALDTTRLGNALARPGIDTRIWSSLAVVKAIHVDSKEGVFIDVTLMPTRNPGTARLGIEYAGNSFGMYTPVEVDDEVMVVAPSGDPNEGLVVTRRLHSASDPPPSQVVAHPQDVVVVVKSDKNLRLLVGGTGKVVLADDAASQSSVRGSAYRSAEDDLFVKMAAAFAETATGLSALGQSSAANAAMAAAFTAFNLLLSTFLTNKVVLP